MAERFGYKHARDFLAAHPNGADLTDMYAYLYRDDEVQLDRLTYAVTKAIMQTFGNSKKQQTPVDDDGEPVIDTTDPEFAKRFQGFIGVPGQRP